MFLVVFLRLDVMIICGVIRYICVYRYYDYPAIYFLLPVTFTKDRLVRSIIFIGLIVST